MDKMDEESKGSDYVKVHEEFMQHHNGTSIWENFILISPAPIYIFLTCCVLSYLKLYSLNSSNKRTWIFFLEFCGYILPLILNLTVLNQYSFEVLILSFTLYGSVIFFLHLNSSDALSSEKRIVQLHLKPFISYFRAVVNFITVICILAVDFDIFPRRFAKTENYGYGLMDTGVGFYVVVNAIVSKPGVKRGFLVTLRDIMILLALGVLRMMSVSSLDYQSHLSEYGVHWNFFFTLAAVKMVGNCAACIGVTRTIILALLTCVCHQCILTCGLEDWVTSDVPRTSSLISANREGLSSLPGYTALYFAAAALSHYLHRINSTSHRIYYLTYFIRLFAISLFFTLAAESMFNISRRVANLTYILWMFSMSVYVIIVCICLELSLVLLYTFSKDSITPYVPVILSSINYNGMPFFLLANALTGLVNICFKTIYMNHVSSLIIIISYMLIVTFVTCGLNWYRIKIRL